MNDTQGKLPLVDAETLARTEADDLARRQAILRSNPMPSGYGRNDFCPCGSGVKYKRCCRPGSMAAFEAMKAGATASRDELADLFKG